MKTRSQQPCFHRSEWWNHVFISCLLLFCVSKWHLWALPPPSVRLKFLLAPPPAWWYLLTNTFHTGDGWEADERLDLWDRLSLIPSRWSSSWACVRGGDKAVYTLRPALHENSLRSCLWWVHTNLWYFNLRNFHSFFSFSSFFAVRRDKPKN